MTAAAPISATFGIARLFLDGVRSGASGSGMGAETGIGGIAGAVFPVFGGAVTEKGGGTPGGIGGVGPGAVAAGSVDAGGGGGDAPAGAGPPGALGLSLNLPISTAVGATSDSAGDTAAGIAGIAGSGSETGAGAVRAA
ncbi:MAG: hypothetical protein RIQ93_3526 [Verrucomicrobiota bacterium]|jgi:hypothetical protein